METLVKQNFFESSCKDPWECFFDFWETLKIAALRDTRELAQISPVLHLI